MKIRQLLVAVVVLAALGAALYWSDRRQPALDAAKIAADEPTKMLSLDRDSLSKIEIKKKDGDDVVLTKAAPDNWKITAPQSLSADQDQISSLLSTLSVIDADRIIEDKASDLKSYGLADPRVTISATGKDGAPRKLEIGDDTPAGSASYAMVAGDPRVFTVSAATKSGLDKGVKDLRDKRLLPIDFDKASGVEVSGPKLNLTFSSVNGQWLIRDPKDIRGDTSKLEGMVEKLKTLTMDPTTSDDDAKKAASGFSTGTRLATAKVTGPSASYDLQIHKSKDAYYAKTSAMDGAFKVPNDLGEQVGQSLDDFREKKVLDPSSSDPDKVDMQSGSKSYALTRKGEDWFLDGKKLDPISSDAFLRSIRDLTATKFVSTGFSNPVITLTVTSMDGKHVEKVQIAKNGDHAVAKRENDPTLYEMDAKVIDDLQKSADGMKPADTPKT